MTKLKDEQIPIAARLFAVVDVWDALRSDRPYRQGWPEAKVREHIYSRIGLMDGRTVARAAETIWLEEHGPLAVEAMGSRSVTLKKALG